MSIPQRLFFKSLVKPYYRQNAGLLGGLFFIMFLAVGKANGVGVLEYHYSLIQGMMINPTFLAVVMAAWLAYAAKCAQFIALTLRKQEFSYLYMLSQVNVRKAYLLLLQVQLTLFLPVLAYLIIILGVGYHKHWYAQSALVLIFNISVCLVSACWYLHLLRNPESVPYVIKWKMPSLFKRKYYGGFLIRYVLASCKVLFIVIKFYSCGVLYLMVADRNPAKEDLRMVLLFYSVGVLGHGVLIHRLKEMENTRLSFYRGLPISLAGRYAQYGWFYFFIFIPEMVTIASLTPAFLQFPESSFLVFFGLSILLLLNSLLLFNFSGMADYLKAVAGMFFAIFIAMLAGVLHGLCILFFLLSVIIFFRRYYRHEP
jgi:hypothetical protein